MYRVLCEGKVILEIIINVHFYLPTLMSLLLKKIAIMFFANKLNILLY